MCVPTWYEVGICRKVVHPVKAAYGYTTWRNHIAATQYSTKIVCYLGQLAPSLPKKHWCHIWHFMYKTYIQFTTYAWMYIYAYASKHMYGACEKFGLYNSFMSFSKHCYTIMSRLTPDSSWLQTQPVTCSSLSLKCVFFLNCGKLDIIHVIQISLTLNDMQLKK